jgi:hypothetical protein
MGVEMVLVFCVKLGAKLGFIGENRKEGGGGILSLRGCACAGVCMRGGVHARAAPARGCACQGCTCAGLHMRGAAHARGCTCAGLHMRGAAPCSGLHMPRAAPWVRGSRPCRAGTGGLLLPGLHCPGLHLPRAALAQGCTCSGLHSPRAAPWVSRLRPCRAGTGARAVSLNLAIFEGYLVS